MIEFGLIGYPLNNTFSKDFYAERFKKLGLSNHVYKNFPLSSLEDFEPLLKQSDTFGGFNVTIPYKQSIITYLNTLSDEAMACNAVNCIKMVYHYEHKKYFLKGYNTDVYGFEQSFKPLLNDLHKNSQALILGSGGAAQAVIFILKKLGIRYKIASRKLKTPNCIPYSAITEDVIVNHLMIINCTPLGMYPNIESKPDIPYQFIGKHHLCYDLVYLPVETAFLNACTNREAITKNGLEMLQLQAEKNLEIWLSNEF
ncbi:MAG: shikimate dehydrogenase family protein [Bacteroidota bacterium]|jgi:shikimate dehydrogenase|nr:shikimate dehydrogenase [Sphingobacteriales bacterium]